MGRFDDNVNAQNGERVAIAHTIHGSPIAGALMPQQIGAEGRNIALLTQPHISDYKPPPRRRKDNPAIALCSEDGCNAYPLKEKPYCTGHARLHGMMPQCAKEGCGMAPKNGQRHCRWHEPVAKVTSGDAE